MAAVHDTRLAKNYALVYELVLAHGTGKHVTASQVLAEAKVRRPGMGETTVYRALARLRDLGLLAEVALPGGASTYYELPVAPHAHFRCEKCGRVDDVDYALPAAVVEELAVKQRAKVASVHLSLHGLCVRCRGGA